MELKFIILNHLMMANRSLQGSRSPRGVVSACLSGQFRALCSHSFSWGEAGALLCALLGQQGWAGSAPLCVWDVLVTAAVGLTPWALPARQLLGDFLVGFQE